MDIQTAVTRVSGTGIPVPGNDIDTDQIIPARYMKVVTFDGLGEYAFHDVRYDEKKTPRDHPFNDPRFAGASVLVVNRNFGCGSSREHAPQALMRWGIRAVVGESFAEIFNGNCTAMGIPAVTLDHDQILAVMAAIERNPKVELSIDLSSGLVTVGDQAYSFTMDSSYRSALVAGSWDSTSVLLSNMDGIAQTAGSLPYIGGF